jgi:hypothetical protein
MQEVKLDDLIQGREYWLECFTNDDERQLVSHNPPYKMIARFDKLIHTKYDSTVAGFTNFRDIKFKNDTNIGYSVALNNYYWKFYEIIKNKVQDDMEKRAHDKILRQVIRDEYYKY